MDTRFTPYMPVSPADGRAIFLTWQELMTLACALRAYALASASDGRTRLSDLTLMEALILKLSVQS